MVPGSAQRRGRRDTASRGTARSTRDGVDDTMCGVGVLASITSVYGSGVRSPSSSGRLRRSAPRTVTGARSILASASRSAIGASRPGISRSAACLTSKATAAWGSTSSSAAGTQP